MGTYTSCSVMPTLDINVILSQEERIPCTFGHTSLKLGHLDASVEDNDIAEGTQVDIPMWLGEQLESNRMVAINPPKHFGKKMRDEMRAGAASVNLREFSYYFFDVGLHLAHISHDDVLRDTLEKAFTGDRYRTLTVHSLTPGTNDDASEYSQSLTSSELEILKKGLRSLQNLQNWRSSGGMALKKARVLARRDRSDADDSATKRNRK